MNISQALCAAADHIEGNPASYQFMCSQVPREGEQGCMLGHFARVAGLRAGLPIQLVCWEVLGISDMQFYKDIYEASSLACLGGEEDRVMNVAVKSAAIVPDAMRKVAKKFEGIPQDVREIFNSKQIPDRYSFSAFFPSIQAQRAMRRAQPQPGQVYNVALDTYTNA